MSIDTMVILGIMTGGLVGRFIYMLGMKNGFHAGWDRGARYVAQHGVMMITQRMNQSGSQESPPGAAGGETDEHDPLNDPDWWKRNRG